MNFLKGKVANGYFHIEEQKIQLLEPQYEYLKAYENKEVILGIRPENISSAELYLKAYPECILNVEIKVSELFGREYVVQSQLNDQKLVYLEKISASVEVDTSESVAIEMSKAHFFDSETNEVIRGE